MCELFAMSSSHPATVTYSMREFALHGGLTADHVDGWGIAYVEDRAARVFRDTDAAAESPYLQIVSATGIRSSSTVIRGRRPVTASSGRPDCIYCAVPARSLRGRLRSRASQLRQKPSASCLPPAFRLLVRDGHPSPRAKSRRFAKGR